MLEDSYQSMLAVSTRDEFRDEVIRFTRKLGFDTVGAVTVIDHPIGDTEFVQVHNTPAAYIDSFNDAHNWKVDPVVQHCKRLSVPIIWDQSTYVTSGQGEKWEAQASFGFRTGISLALHMPEGRHFMIGVDRDQALPKDRREVTRMVADLQLFAVHAQDIAMRVLIPETLQIERPKLSPRELDGLRWTMEGKTAWEVASILGIAERTAVLHINTAMHKLGCNTKHQAVLKALRLGLLR